MRIISKLKAKAKKCRRGTRGDLSLEVLYGLMIVLCVLYFVIQLVAFIVAGMKIMHVAEELTRTIELAGNASEQVGSDYYKEVERLHEETGIPFTVEVVPDNLWRGGDTVARELQLRERFTVTVTAPYKFNYADTTLQDAGERNLMISRSVSGRSEVYFK